MSENNRHTGEFMHIEALRKLAGREEIDYQFLLSALKEYRYPRDKISEWLSAGHLIRVKKGLYVFGKNAALQPYSQEILANLIYGPSAISLAYALSFHGLIPERVSVITSVTNKRQKEFSTPVGHFRYYYLNPIKYSIGIELSLTTSNQYFLIASAEKALSDQICIIDNKLKLKTLKDMKSYLFHDLRIDEEIFSELKTDNLLQLSVSYHSQKIALLAQLLAEMK